MISYEQAIKFAQAFERRAIKLAEELSVFTKRWQQRKVEHNLKLHVEGMIKYYEMARTIAKGGQL